MACLEVNCLDCDHVEFTNNILKTCPNCDSPNISIVWDEQFDNHDDFNSFDLESSDWEE